MLSNARLGNSVLPSRYMTILLSFIALAVTAFGFYFLRFGFDVNDEAYQTMNAMEPLINPQAILSSTLSGLFGRCFGYSFLSMRALTFLLYVLSIGFSALYYYRVKGNPRVALLLYILLLSASLCTPTKSRLIGWDCYAVFFTTLSMLSIVSVWRGGGWPRIVALGVLAGCATLCRFPDVVLVPVAVLAMFVCGGPAMRGVHRSVLFLAVYSAAVLGLLSLIYGGDPLAWFESLRAGFVSGHHPGRLIGAYIHTGRLDFLDIALLLVFLFVAARFLGEGWKRVAAYVFLFAVLAGVMFLKLDRVFYTVCRLLTAGVVMLSVVYVVVSKKKERWRSLLQALVLLGCCAVPMAGSDGGTFKFMNITALPVLFALLPEMFKSRVGATAVRMVWVILLSIALVMPFFTASHTTFDGGWRDARAAVNHPLLAGNSTTETRASEINEMLAEGRRVVPDSAIIIGHNNRRFFSEFLFGRRNTLWPHSWDDRIFDDPDKISTLLEAVDSGKVGDIVFVKYGANDFYGDFRHNPMREAIEATGLFRAADYKWFVVFSRVSSE